MYSPFLGTAPIGIAKIGLTFNELGSSCAGNAKTHFKHLGMKGEKG